MMMQKNQDIRQEDYNFLHFTPVQIRYNDIDILGHVNNAVFQYYFDYGKMKYFSALFGDTLPLDNVSLIIASIHIDYLQPVYLEHKITVASKTILLGNKSLHMVQEIHKLPGNERMAFSRSVMVAFDKEAGCSVTIPHSWRESVMNYEKEVALKPV